MRNAARPGRSVAGSAAGGRGVLTDRRVAAAVVSDVRQYELPEVRRTSDAGYRHDGHVCRLVVVLPALLQPARMGGGLRSRKGRFLDAGRSVHWRHRARDDAPALRSLLHQGSARHWFGELRRAVQALVQPGVGDLWWVQDVEISWECR